MNPHNSMTSSVYYYPFGMMLPSRNESSSDYRYGFNGMEKDDEVKGDGNSYTTGFRQYDPRVGRWLSLDPMMDKYPNQSPYVAFNNNPLYYTDPHGDDPPEKTLQENAKRLATKTSKFGVPQYRDINSKKESVLIIGESPNGGNVIELWYQGSESPSAKLDDISQKISEGNIAIDCQFYTTMVYALTIRDIIGPAAFDAMMYNEETGRYDMVIDQNGMTGMPFADYKHFDIDSESQLTAFSKANDAPVGSIMILEAENKEKVQEEYQVENFIKVGDNQYAAFPFTKGDDVNFYTMEQLLERLGNDNSGEKYNLTQIGDMLYPESENKE